MGAGDEGIRSRLRRLRRDPQVQAEAPRSLDGPARPDRATGSADEPERLETVVHPRGEFALRLETRDRSATHGAMALGEVGEIDRGAFDRFARDGSLARIDLERAVYLDIETTGLSGGAGTYPFLVALGRFRAGAFEVWQGFLRSPADEHAMLAAAAERIADAGAVVSFFGKSFDRHRLEDKMRLFGVEPPFEGRPHLDLYHPCARLYRPALADGRLATMERVLCGVEREDDLPGSYAPEAWFDYLAGRPHRLEAVFRHNLDDVLSLVTLAAHLGRAAHETRADGRPLEGPAGQRALGLARLAADRGGLEARREALVWLERARERLEPTGPAHRPLLRMRADLLRLTGDHGAACADYFDLAEAEDEHGVHALIELAKHAEHRRRDPARAADLCRRARAALERGCTGPAYARLKRDLDKRETRLAAKVGDPPDPAESQA